MRQLHVVLKSLCLALSPCHSRFVRLAVGNVLRSASIDHECVGACVFPQSLCISSLLLCCVTRVVLRIFAALRDILRRCGA